MHGRTRRRHRHGRRRGPFGRGRFFGPGEVRLALLALLAEGPKHGYELMNALEERSAGAYRASAGTVYPTLQQLEDEGLARSESQDGRRVYRPTAQGEAEVAGAQDEIARIWRRAEEWGDWTFVADPDAAEIVRPAMRLLREAYRTVIRGHGDPDVVDRVRAVLERARDELRDLRRR